MFKIRVIPSAQTYRIFAEFKGVKKEANVDGLPATFKDTLRPLQDIILQATSALRKVPPANIPARPPTPAPQGVATRRNLIPIPTTANADVRMIEETGATLFKFIFQEDVGVLYREARQAAQKQAIPSCRGSPCFD